MPAVSGLGDEFPGKVQGRNVDATSEEGVKAVAEMGFRSHGIVIRDSKGAVLFKQPDHNVKLDDVRSELKKLLGT
ncbi:MAG TPA: hypothetical protein VFG76_06935 [Candidatus Polarisedimenticolia bacterium]|nr:hypothetical protein [Candidatus Polarisedimenticolia bacterium]